jgi:hypothetical protein
MIDGGSAEDQTNLRSLRARGKGQGGGVLVLSARCIA